MGMPIITGSGTTREQAITDLIESVALEQASISYILDAEATKFRKAFVTTEQFSIGVYLIKVWPLQFLN